jgi:hypothetical protein
MWGALSDDRTGLLFTTAAGPRQHSHSCVRVPRDTRLYFIVSDSRLLQPGGPSPYICIPQGYDGPIIPQGIGFPFCYFLRFAGLRRRCSSPSPHGHSKKFWEEFIPYVPLIRHKPHIKRQLEQFVCCCGCICCRGNVFTRLTTGCYTYRHTDSGAMINIKFHKEWLRHSKVDLGDTQRAW